MIDDCVDPETGSRKPHGIEQNFLVFFADASAEKASDNASY